MRSDAILEPCRVLTVTARGNSITVGKIRRGGYVFVTWAGDHAPRHVHVYRDGAFVVKWDLETDTPMRGQANDKVKRLIAELKREGRL